LFESKSKGIFVVNTPLVSILIPAFNAEKYLGQTLECASSQSWANKEIIVVDDGSTDETLNVSRRFENKKWIKVITQENIGASAARNRALREAQGEYIQYLDSDDLMDERKIELQIRSRTFCESSELYSCSSFGFYLNPKFGMPLKNSLWQNLSASQWLYKAAKYGHWLPPHAYLVPRKLIEKAGFWDERLSLNDDGEYFFRLIGNCNYIKFCPEATVYYRRGNIKSLSSQRSKRHLESLFLSIELSIEQLFGKLEEEIADEAAIKYLQYNIDKFQIKEGDFLEKFYELSKKLGGVINPPKLSTKHRFFRLVCGESNANILKSILEQKRYKVGCSIEKTFTFLGSFIYWLKRNIMSCGCKRCG
jgi:glycosyltransferase involved in cell wall biosynthesis